jgi:hypothetical protein
VWVSRLAARQEGRLDLARADDEKAASLATPEDWQNVRWSERDRLMGRAMNRRTLILWAGKLDRDYARVRPRAITGQAFSLVGVVEGHSRGRRHIDGGR